MQLDAVLSDGVDRAGFDAARAVAQTGVEVAVGAEAETLLEDVVFGAEVRVDWDVDGELLGGGACDHLPGCGGEVFAERGEQEWEEDPFEADQPVRQRGGEIGAEEFLHVVFRGLGHEV